MKIIKYIAIGFVILCVLVSCFIGGAKRDASERVKNVLDGAVYDKNGNYQGNQFR